MRVVGVDADRRLRARFALRADVRRGSAEQSGSLARASRPTTRLCERSARSGAVDPARPPVSPTTDSGVCFLKGDLVAGATTCRSGAAGRAREAAFRMNVWRALTGHTGATGPVIVRRARVDSGGAVGAGRFSARQAAGTRAASRSLVCWQRHSTVMIRCPSCTTARRPPTAI
jgi:hypothetical protein